MSRKGIPDGWAGRRPEVIAIRARAAEQAKEIVKTMKELDLIKTDEDRAEAALEFAVSVIFAKDEKGKHTYQAREQLSAAKLVLEYTKQKPTTKNETTLHKAEDFLAAVAASMK